MISAGFSTVDFNRRLELRQGAESEHDATFCPKEKRNPKYDRPRLES
jgi:hypothetical protein